jgi:hypothetical protein
MVVAHCIAVSQSYVTLAAPYLPETRRIRLDYAFVEKFLDF